MVESPSTVRPWLMVLGGMAVVAALYAAQDIVVPIALAALLTFVLSPAVTWFERRVGRVPAVLGVVLVVFVTFGLAGWALTRQLNALAVDLPRYRENLTERLSELRKVGETGVINEVVKTIEGVQEKLAAEAPPPRPRDADPLPVFVLANKVEGLSIFGWLGPLIGLAGTGGLIITLVIFMLLERRDLRDRLIKVVGQGHVALTTKALDEAGSRVSRQLFMQTIVNSIYGVVVAIGLLVIGVPYPLVWAALGAALRYIPYVGPMIGAGAPIVFSIAVTAGWQTPLLVSGFFVTLELFTNLVLETVLYADAAGVSQVALLVAVTFWTWLWGPIGLLMATPLTVCVVVLGKHVTGLEFIATMMADAPPLTASHGYYQRLLARDPGEAADFIERHMKTEAPRLVYDTLMLPALNNAEFDRLKERLTPDEEAGVLSITRELLADTADQIRRAEGMGAAPANAAGGEPLRVLGYPVNGASDELALEMLSRAVDDLPITLDVSTHLMASEIASWVRAHGISVLCLADLPPSAASRSRYLVRKIRAAAPDLRIMVGRWAPPSLADESADALTAAGASHVASTMEQSRSYLKDLVALRPTTEPAPAAPAVGIVATVATATA